MTTAAQTQIHVEAGTQRVNICTDDKMYRVYGSTENGMRVYLHGSDLPFDVATLDSGDYDGDYIITGDQYQAMIDKLQDLVAANEAASKSAPAALVKKA